MPARSLLSLLLLLACGTATAADDPAAALGRSFVDAVNADDAAKRRELLVRLFAPSTIACG